MLSPRLALRNVFAHRQRSLIMLIVVGLAVFVVFLFTAFSDGQMENARKGFLALLSPTADIAVYSTGLKTAQDEGEDWKRTSALSIKGYPALLDEIRAMSFVARACNPTIPLELDIFAGGRKYRNFLFRGVEPAQGWIVQDYIRMTKGAFFDDSQAPQVILHEKTATAMRIRPGDTITIVGKDLFGQVVVQEVVFKGLYVPHQDMPYLIDHGFMNMAAYRLISGFSPDEAMSLFLNLKSGESRHSAVEELRQWAASRKLDLEFWDFKELPRNTFDIYELLRLIFMAASLLIVAIMTFGIMSVVSVNLFDRKREIGTYYCLGSEKGFLIRLYTLEILFINIAATLAGVLAGLAVRQVVNSLALTTDTPGLQLLFGGSRFSLGFSPGSLLFIVCATAVVIILTTGTTLRARLRVSPMAALRETE